MSSRSLRRNRRAAAAGALAATLGFAGLGLAASPAQALPGFAFERLAGADRILTAVDISQDSFAAADTVLIARADLFPDALAGNYLAGAEGAPILLSHTDHVPQETLDEVERLGATNVTLLGGTAALSEDVAAEFEAAGLTVGREAGTDRYKTAADIATSQDAATIGDTADGRTAILATGERFPDALTGGPLAYAGSHPLLLTPTASLGEDAAGALETLGIEHVLILGGTAAVSQAAEDAVEAMGITTERLQGNTRYDTATAIAEWALANAGFTDAHINVATGQNFPDALTGGPHAGEEVTPIILANDGNTAEAVAYLEDHANTLVDGHIFGGTAAVSQAVEDALEAAGQNVTSAAATTRPELVSAAIGTTTTDAQVSPTNPAGTRVSYVFDENIDLFAPTGANFHVYNADGSKADTDNGVVLSRSGNTVVVNFPGLNTAALAAPLTLATVDFGAVTDNQGQTNPEGDAAVGTAAGPGTVGAAGITNAPDLVSVGNFRAAANAGFTAVDFTFDEAAFVEVIDGFDLIAVNGVELDCTGPAADDALTPASGGTSPGGNGTTTITVVCENVPAGDGTGATLTAAGIARGTVVEGSLSDTAAAGGNLNELQAADVGNGGNTSEPDLVSATFQPSAGTADDQVLFVFDENVSAADFNDFGVYDIGGTRVAGTAAAINPANATQVLVNFPDGTLSDAVGANVVDGAVTASDNGVTSQQDEVGVANTQSTAGRTPGETAAPELRGVALAQGSDQFGNPTGFQATYTFDEPITVAVTAGEFNLYLADGTQLVGTTCARVAAAGSPAGTAGENQVRCTAFGAATSAQIGSATVGTVDNGAVVAVDNAQTNPEGAELTTGGTGTPAA